MHVNFEEKREKLRELFVSQYASMPILIWGSGMCAEEFLASMPGLAEHISYYVDKDQKKWGTVVHGVEVISPDTFYDRYQDENCSLIIATMYFQQVLEELAQHAYKGNVYSAFHVISRDHYFGYTLLEEHREELRDIFSDDKSRDLLDAIIEKRKRIEVDYTDWCEPDQYFIPGLVPVDEEAVFVDGGAYHGETIDAFVKFQGGKFKKIYAFEMDKANYERMQENQYEGDVELLNYGLWDTRMTCAYSSQGTSSALDADSAEGDLVAACIGLDEVIGTGEVTYIKMDIEGAEYKALMGAEQCIKRCRPNLAICVYHKSEDIYQLTVLLHKWLPEHRFYLRHHAANFTETVLYCLR